MQILPFFLIPKKYVSVPRRTKIQGVPEKRKVMKWEKSHKIISILLRSQEKNLCSRKTETKVYN